MVSPAFSQKNQGEEGQGINKEQNKGTQGVGAMYDAELPPFMSIVRHTGRPVIFRVHAEGGVILCERACFCLLSAFYNTPLSKNLSKKLCLYWNPCKAPSKNPSKKHLLVENLLRTLLRAARGCMNPLGVHPNIGHGNSTPCDPEFGASCALSLEKAFVVGPVFQKPKSERDPKHLLRP